MHLRWTDVARLDQAFNLRDRQSACHSCQRVEVHGRLLEHEVAVCVAKSCMDEGDVGRDSGLQDVALAVEDPGLLGRRCNCDRPIGVIPLWQTPVRDR